MRKSAIFKLSAVLIFLLALVAGRFGWQKWRGSLPNLYQKRVTNIKAQAIDEIKITQGETQLIFRKKEGKWQLNDKRVDQDKIRQLLNNLLDGDKAELIARTENRHQALKVDSSQATKVELSQQGKILASLLVGTTTTSGIYVRITDQPEVFLLGSKLGTISLEPQAWYEKTIVQFSQEEIKKLKFQFAKEKFTLEKTNGSWQLESGGEVDSEKINSLLATLSSFEAESLATEEEQKDYPNKPTLTLSIEAEKEEELQFFAGDEDYLVEKASTKEFFLVPSYLAERFIHSRSEWLKED